MSEVRMLCMLEVTFSVCVIEICPPTGNNNARTDLFHFTYTPLKNMKGGINDHTPLVVANILKQATCKKLVKLMKVQVSQNAA